MTSAAKSVDPVTPARHPAKAQRPRRVAVFFGGIPHPTAGASTVIFYHYIHALVAAGHTLLCIPMVSPRGADLRALEVFANGLNATGRVTIAPIEVGPIHEPSGWRLIDRTAQAAQEITAQVNEFRPEAIVCFDLAAAAVAKDLAAPVKTVWLGDLAFAAQWHNFLYGIAEDPFRIRWLPYMLAQRRQWKRLYRDILSHFDPVIVSSISSVDEMARLGVPCRYEPYPWPEDTAGRDAQSVALNKRPTFLFFGTLAALGSRSSFHFLFRRLYPRLVRMWGEGGFEILLAGRGAMPDWATKEVARRPECRHLGFVDDLATLMARCHAVIVPIAAPVGNRSRILTALANGALVIAHANVARGNPALVHRQTCLLADKVDRFAELMLEAFESPERMRQIRQAGQEMYRQSFALEAAAPLFARIIGARN